MAEGSFTLNIRGHFSPTCPINTNGYYRAQEKYTEGGRVRAVSFSPEPKFFATLNRIKAQYTKKVSLINFND